MHTTKQTLSENIRIIWAIALKDIIDAIKNKTILTSMLGTALLVLISQALPLLLQFQDLPKAYAFDPGESANIEALVDERSAFRVYRVPSIQALKNDLVEAPDVRLGLVIPVDFDQLVKSAEQIEIQGYTVHWATQKQVNELGSIFESQLSEQVSVAVKIQVEGNVVYPQPDSGGFVIMISLALVLVIVTLGIILVPYLMIEEKETHTIEALLVSPARYTQVVTGKAIAGMFYCLAAAAVVLLVHHGLIAHWGIVFLTVICGSLFAVSLGLSIGMFFDNPTNMNLWGGLLIAVLMVPMLLSTTIGVNFPAAIQALLPWLPSVAMVNLLRLSLAEDIFPLPTLFNLGILTGFTILLLALVILRLRRMDR
jgi:ABC-2 type transport system permease protein